MQGRDLLLIVSVMAIWGFNFSMIKLGVTGMDPLLIAAARFACATFPIIFFIRRPKVPWRYLMGYGLLFGTGIWGMASCAITFGLSSGMASVLLQLDVLTTVLVGVLLYKEIISPRMWLGMGMALVGLVVSILYTNGNVTPAGVAFILISAICWPLAGVMVRQSGTRSPFAFNIWGMLFAPLPLIGLSVLFNGVEVLEITYRQWNAEAWLSVLFQAYPTTLFGYWVWNKMLLKYPMSQMAPLTLLVSVFALASGYLIYGERLSAAQWLSCSAFLLGVGLVLYRGPLPGAARAVKQQKAVS
ncbi:EamA family transporter [Zobellella iuensis]|uniref:EamA family transporter n=1 Tax=Zobellella iuensis TaxID=2803811 RepID=A0ABS1QRA9_9GAMM|nr:EamA family transporter [Zobellella iuensis]MBL1377011.1 EamA family transporter [Zobellella iuensis]